MGQAIIFQEYGFVNISKYPVNATGHAESTAHILFCVIDQKFTIPIHVFNDFSNCFAQFLFAGPILPWTIRNNK